MEYLETEHSECHEKPSEMPRGAVFYIKSHLNGLVLDVTKAKKVPGTSVKTYKSKMANDAENQLWYMDPFTKTIRTTLNDFCLDMDEDNRLCINPYDPGQASQKWQVKDDMITNLYDHSRALDIVGASKSSGAKICLYEKHGEPNQRWSFEHAPTRYFYIESVLNGMVLDVKGGSTGKGAKLIVFPRKIEDGEDPDNQLFYFDQDGLIRSKLNTYVLDASDKHVELEPYLPGNEKQGFCIDSDGYIGNKHDPTQVVQIKEAEDKECAKLVVSERMDQAHQKWRVV